MTVAAIMKGVREYTEGDPVELQLDEKTGRMIVVATNEGGCNETAVDVLDLLDWVRTGGHGLGDISSGDGNDLSTN